MLTICQVVSHLSAPNVRSTAFSQENHSRARRQAPIARRSHNSGIANKVSIAWAKASGSLGEQRKTFVLWMNIGSVAVPWVVIIGRPCAEAPAKELLCIQTP